MRAALRLFTLIGAFTLTACSDDGGGGEGEGCDACGGDEVCVTYLGSDTEEDREECAATPSACGGSVDCSATDCTSALYGLCDAGWVGVGCSPSGGSALVSCNPDM